MGEYVARNLARVPGAGVIGLKATRPWLKKIAPAGMRFVSAFPFGKCRDALKSLGADEVFFVGSPFSSLRPALDRVTLSYMLKRRSFWFPHAYLYAIQDMLSDSGIALRSPLDYFPELGAELGLALGDCKSYEPSADICAAVEAASIQSWKTIRQSFIVDHGKVLMSESQTINGTDRLIKAFGLSPKRETAAFPVLCKIAVAPFHKIDVPTIGAQTARLCLSNGVRAIAVEAGNTIVMQREELATIARSGSICVYAIPRNACA